MMWFAFSVNGIVAGNAAGSINPSWLASSARAEGAALEEAAALAEGAADEGAEDDAAGAEGAALVDEEELEEELQATRTIAAATPTTAMAVMRVRAVRRADIRSPLASARVLERVGYFETSTLCRSAGSWLPRKTDSRVPASA
jgi:hypothetical protein